MSYDLTGGDRRPLTDGLGHPLSVPRRGNFVVGYQNEVLSGAVTVSSFVPGFGGEQLQNDQGSPSMALQTPDGTTTLAILLIRPPNTCWRGFGLFRTNLTPAATVVWNVGLAGGAVYAGASDSVVPGFGQSIHIAPQDAVGDFMQVNIADPTNPQGHINIPLMYAGGLWQGARNFLYASAIVPTDSGITTETRGGGEFVRTDWRKRGFDLALGAVAPEEVWYRVDRLDGWARAGNNVFFVPSPADPDVNRAALFGRLKPTAGVGYANQSARTRSWRATITERL